MAKIFFMFFLCGGWGEFSPGRAAAGRGVRGRTGAICDRAEDVPGFALAADGC